MSILTADFYICYLLFLKCFSSPTCLMISSSSSYSLTPSVISSRKRLHWSHWGNHFFGSSINEHVTLKWNSLHASLSLFLCQFLECKTLSYPCFLWIYLYQIFIFLYLKKWGQKYKHHKYDYIWNSTLDLRGLKHMLNVDTTTNEHSPQGDTHNIHNEWQL